MVHGGTVFSLDVSAADVDSTLDTVDGFNILLNKEGDLVVGRVDAANDGDVDNGDAIAFAISIDGSTGIISVAQYLAIAHPLTGLNGVNHNDELSISEDVLLAVATATDGDGDTSTATTGIGDAVKFRDDGPVAAISQVGMVTHDETSGVDAGTDDQPNASLPAAFAGLAGTLIGWAESDGAVVNNTGTVYGTDGAWRHGVLA